MNKNACTMLVLASLLSACGSSDTGGNSVQTAAAQPSPTRRLAEVNKAYADSGIQAKRAWGGKRVVVGGAFDSSGRNPDGTASILVSPGDMPPTLGEFNVGSGADDLVAKLKKGDDVTMECTVDPTREGFTAGYVDCVPAGQKS